MNTKIITIIIFDFCSKCTAYDSTHCLVVYKYVWNEMKYYCSQYWYNIYRIYFLSRKKNKSKLPTLRYSISKKKWRKKWRILNVSRHQLMIMNGTLAHVRSVYFIIFCKNKTRLAIDTFLAKYFYTKRHDNYRWQMD